MNTANRKPAGRPVKIPRGFVMVNLSTDEQKELRELARLAGYDLRGALRSALSDLRQTLKQDAIIHQKTGLRRFEWCYKFGYQPARN